MLRAYEAVIETPTGDNVDRRRRGPLPNRRFLDFGQIRLRQMALSCSHANFFSSR